MTFEEWAAERTMSSMEREFARDAWEEATKAARKAHGEPAGEVIGNLNGKLQFNVAAVDIDLPIGTKLYTAPAIPEGYMLAKRYFCTKCRGAFTTQSHNGCDYMAMDMLATAPKSEDK